MEDIAIIIIITDRYHACTTCPLPPPPPIVALHALLQVVRAHGIEQSTAESVAISSIRPNLHKMGAKVGPFHGCLVRVPILLALVHNTNTRTRT